MVKVNHQNGLRAAIGAFGAAAMLAMFSPGPQSEAQAQNSFWSDEYYGAPKKPRPGRTTSRPGSSGGFSARGGPPVTNVVLLSRGTIAATDQAIAGYRRVAQAGGWRRIPKGERLRVGASGRRVLLLRRRLIMTADLSNRYGASSAFDETLENAVKRFQYRNGLTPSGIVNRRTLAELNVSARHRLDLLVASRKRLAALTARTAGKRYVLVNIPGYELQAVSGGRLELSSRVVVGKPSTPTPQLGASIRAVNFMPYWHVPQSIAKRALIPRIKKDPGYLARQHIRVFASWGGAEVDPSQVNWWSPQGQRYVFRQDPGPFNALGVIRIDMPNRQIVYMHDTPLKKLFGYHLRPYSAGCVRVQQIQPLAQWLLRQEGGWSSGRIRGVVQQSKKQNVKLSRRTPVYFSYISAWATGDGLVRFRTDIYGKGVGSSGAWRKAKQGVAP